MFELAEKCAAGRDSVMHLVSGGIDNRQSVDAGHGDFTDRERGNRAESHDRHGIGHDRNCERGFLAGHDLHGHADRGDHAERNQLRDGQAGNHHRHHQRDIELYDYTLHQFQGNGAFDGHHDGENLRMVVCV